MALLRSPTHAVPPLAWGFILVIGAALSNCKSSESTTSERGTGSAGDGGAGPVFCDDHEDCNDGIFCNGEERCLELEGVKQCTFPDHSPCLSGQRCAESQESCVTACEVAYDADRDGHDAVECGGDDCDDSTPRRFPGNQEVCDEAGLDEDCDPNTLGGRGDSDLDLDGFVAMECCNVTSDGTVCGDDCDDRQRDVGPGLNEICNGIDDNCNGRIDEGLKRDFTPDEDGDGFGDASDDAEVVRSCSPVEGLSDLLTDCDDSNAAINPTAYDRCDSAMVDDDCNGTPNDPANGCACNPGTSQFCPFPGRCEGSIQLCVEGMWAEECSVTPIDEICGNGVDDNCDGAVDEQCACQGTIQLCGATSVGDCQAGLQECLADGTWGGCAGAILPKTEVCGGGDEDCDGAIDESCSPASCSNGRGDCDCNAGSDQCSCTGLAFGSECACGFDRNVTSDANTLAYPDTGPIPNFTAGDFYITPTGNTVALGVTTYGLTEGNGDWFSTDDGVNIRRNLGMAGITIWPENAFSGTASYSLNNSMGTEVASGTVSGNPLRIHRDGQEFTSVTLTVTSASLRIERIESNDCD